MRRLKALLFALFLVLVQSPQYFWPEFIAESVMFRYAVYTLTLVSIGVMGFFYFRSSGQKWPVKLWVSFYLLTTAVLLLTGLYYFFAGRNPMLDVTVAYFRYFACSPFPFVILYFLSGLGAVKTKS